MARIGTQQLAGVGFGTIASFILILFSFLSLLTTPKVAAAWGKGNYEQVSKISAAAVYLAFVLGTFCAVIIWFGSDVLVAVVKPDPEVARYGLNFIKAKCWASPALLVSYVLSGTFRGIQDTRSPLVGNAWGYDGLVDVVFGKEIECNCGVLVSLVRISGDFKYQCTAKQAAWMFAGRAIQFLVSYPTTSVLPGNYL